MNSPDLIDQQAALLNALHDGQSVEQAIATAPPANQPDLEDGQEASEA